MGVPGGSDGKESTCQCRRPRVDPWVGKIPWRREWLPIPVFLPGESHRQRSLSGYSPWSHKESDMTERLTLFPSVTNLKPSLSGSRGGDSWEAGVEFGSVGTIAFPSLFLSFALSPPCHPCPLNWPSHTVNVSGFPTDCRTGQQARYLSKILDSRWRISTLFQKKLNGFINIHSHPK